MGERHVIDELHVELAFPDEAAAFDGQSRWETLVNRHLLAVAEDVFAKFGEPGEVRRYERIEVDLGAVPADISTTEAERRFRERLLMALERTPHEGDDTTPQAARVLSHGRSELEQFTHFLTHGRLPWHAAGAGFDPARLASTVLHSHRNAFAGWLRQASDRDRIVRRLVQQCGADLAARWTASLSTTDPARVIELAALLVGAFGGTSRGADAGAVEHAVHEAMLQTVLSRGAPAMEDGTLARETFKRVARLRGVTHTGTAAQLRSALGRLRSTPAPTDAHRRWHEAISGETSTTAARQSAANDVQGDAPEDSVAHADPTPATSLSMQWAGALAAAFTRGDASAVSAVWSMLTRYQAPMVIDALRRHARLVRHRRRMAAHLPLAMLHDVLRLLAPRHGEFFDAILRHPEWFDTREASPADGNAARRSLWAAVLAHLILDADPHLDRGACLDAIVRDQAGRTDVPAATVLAAAIDRVSRVDASDGAAPGILHALRALATAHARNEATPAPSVDVEAPATAADAPPEQWPPPSRASGDGVGTPDSVDDIEEHLERWLARGTVDAGDDTWSRMVAERPARLRTALRRMVNTKGAPRAIERVFSAPMVDDVVRLFAPAGAAFLSEVLHHPGRFDPGRGVGAPAQRARHVREFTLAYLLAERGSTFNNRMYLGNLVRRMAAESNLHYTEVLATLLDALAASPEMSGVPQEMLALLRMLADAAALPLPTRDGRPGLTPATPAPAPAPQRAPAVSARRAHPRAANAPHRTPPAGSRRAQAPSPHRPKAVDPTVADLTRVAVALARSGTIAAEDPIRTDARVRRLLQSSPAALRGLFDRLLEDRHTIERTVAALPEPTLTRVLALLRPGPFAEAQRCADIVATACADAGIGITAPELRRLRWRFVFEHFVAEGRSFRLADFVRGLMASIAAHLPSMRFGRWRARAIDQLRSDHPADERGRVAAILAALDPGSTGRTDLPLRSDPSTLASPLPAPGEVMQVANAGMVIAAPYLPRLFGMLGLLSGNRFVDEAAAARAVHVLQFLVDGNVEPPEHVLVLNKVLCGVPLDRPVPRDIVLTADERQAVEGLIAGMIANWTAIGHTSMAGMRESFLQREGRITLERDAWKLLVEPRAFDMLLDRLPWSIATLRLPWMDRVLHVDWR